MQNLLSKQAVGWGVILVIIIYFISNFFISERLSESRLNLDVLLDNKIKVIKETASIIGSATPSPEVEKLIPECSLSERIETDDLLAKLDTSLPYNKIVRLDRVFASCGDIFAVRRGVMAMSLQNQIDSMSEMIEAREALGNFTDKYSLDKWNELLKTEIKINENLYKLVDVQRQIIAILQLPVSDRSQLEVLQVEAITTKTQMSQNTSRVVELRNELLES